MLVEDMERWEDMDAAWRRMWDQLEEQVGWRRRRGGKYGAGPGALRVRPHGKDTDPACTPVAFRVQLGGCNSILSSRHWRGGGEVSGMPCAREAQYSASQ